MKFIVQQLMLHTVYYTMDNINIVHVSMVTLVLSIAMPVVLSAVERMDTVHLNDYGSYYLRWHMHYIPSSFVARQNSALADIHCTW